MLRLRRIFKNYQETGSRLRRILNDRELTAEILSL